ncbi:MULTISPECIES: aspartate ammonia-lyase [Brucella]|uniref:Aspartate ammonia-lyase n=1 Tax=Brucella ceti M644/93/1 TaxID=520459 RepID=A0ABM9ZDG5_9HYPH|nr:MULTISPECIES: aspartate ammonia-lyase [Brucella]AHA98764.1 aspartate ammonia-lyase [Brucella ceti TE10759-12]AHB01371.1 aspartate ammonia-lyase [Brucella ceti TE28753-12]EEX89441.1 aspartate ammonia-lyase [Brucella ceti M13/05/1]EEX97554.1 aspartate ammonia-lyase [Brucella ceti M644/93/1]ENR09713.1 aspartate ammonia-lyase [Brucella sp. UK38/05]
MTTLENIHPLTRREQDSLGERDIPMDAYFGIQTLRAVENFSLSDVALNHIPALVRALAMVKKAAATANYKLRQLPKPKYVAIVAACDDIIDGLLMEQFVVDVFQGGAGTSSNMNANEVIANRALEHLGRPRGDYQTIHPNDDVNMSQSTNDVYPTAVRLALLLSQNQVQTALHRLIAAFEAKGREFATVIKIGRTQLQDAVPITLGQEFEAFAATLREDTARLEEVAALFREVNLGGTAIGTRINASHAYAEQAIAELSQISGIELKAAGNLVEASWDTGAFVTFSGILRRIAVKLSKIANDLRLLSSGPRSGLGEIRLPAVQPGSVNQVCYQVIGNDLTVTMAAESGQLQLNAFEPLIVYNILSSMRLLGRAMTNLAERCVDGIEANVERCRAGAEESISLATALVPVVGYARAAEIAKQALASGQTVMEVAISKGLDASALTIMLDPLRMAFPPETHDKEAHHASVG